MEPMKVESHLEEIKAMNQLKVNSKSEPIYRTSIGSLRSSIKVLLSLEGRLGIDQIIFQFISHSLSQSILREFSHQVKHYDRRK